MRRVFQWGFFRCASLALACTVVGSLGCKPPPTVLVPPQQRNTPQPDPNELAETSAAKAGQSGSVKLGFCIDETGKTKGVKVIESLDPEVDAIAINTVENWTYAPATRDGQPYETCRDTRFTFRFAH